ncbi:hypothetical protein NPIL_45581 [Nephila pilipes]|uniref:Uncharacterized protein n=1 Tax=Nephila pilipes TaxID=299642 RepID=A0A8X6TU53_NEPPI|nr:hypothetical protein NPIL_45581 [Nephila pilipes]
MMPGTYFLKTRRSFIAFHHNTLVVSKQRPFKVPPLNWDRPPSPEKSSKPPEELPLHKSFHERTKETASTHDLLPRPSPLPEKKVFSPFRDRLYRSQAGLQPYSSGAEGRGRLPLSVRVPWNPKISNTAFNEHRFEL